MTRKDITCCRDCEKRVLGCHSSCETYHEQKEELLDTKLLILKAKEKDGVPTVCRSIERLENERKK